jgi:phosphatidate cytidylyltransferase
VAVAAYLTIPVQYALIWLERGTFSSEGYLFFIPLAALVILSAVRMASARPQGFAASLGAVQLAVLISVYGVSHAACVYALPASSNPVGGALGWLLYLLVVTEANDMTQAFCGRAWGAHRATPHISPNKTWEGFLGGVLATMILAAVLAPWITPLARPAPSWQGLPLLGLPYLPALLAGTIIAVGGIIGDLLMSACKRDRGVKDFGTLLPGHGGVLDRFDSLTITAPLFFHLLRILGYGEG